MVIRIDGYTVSSVEVDSNKRLRERYTIKAFKSNKPGELTGYGATLQEAVEKLRMVIQVESNKSED